MWHPDEVIIDAAKEKLKSDSYSIMRKEVINVEVLKPHLSELSENYLCTYIVEFYRIWNDEKSKDEWIFNKIIDYKISPVYNRKV